jgi:hypothetical protein
MLTRIAAMKESSLPLTDLRYAMNVPSNCQLVMSAWPKHLPYDRVVR